MITQRCAAQLLSGRRARSVAGVVERLLAVQAQDARGMRLAIRARSTGVAASDVDRALTDDRSVVVTWLNRGTLHLVLAEDYWWLHGLTAPRQLTGTMRRLAQEGVSESRARRGVEVVSKALDGGPATRAQLGERLGLRGQALIHLLALACLEGVAVRGPVAGKELAYVPVRGWLGRPPKATDRDEALAELARRYLAGHAPATAEDLAKWAGLPLGDARRGLAGVRAPRRKGAVPPPRLLGAYDPLLLGWESREEVLGPHQPVVTVNGLFRPFALVGGRAVATWKLAGGKVEVEPLEQFDAAVLTGEAADVERFLSA